MSTDVFLSVGRTYSANQEQFVTSLERALRAKGLNPRTVGRNDFSSTAPLLRIAKVMDEAHGCIVLAFERSRATELRERPDSPTEHRTQDVKFPTVWNQIEAAMSYARGLPLLVLAETGLIEDGLLEPRYDWYVQQLEVNDAALRSDEFTGVLEDWAQTVRRHAATEPRLPITPTNANDATLKELLGTLTVAQLWKTGGAIVTLLVAIATIAYKVGAASH